jgi:hypothetical protein
MASNIQRGPRRLDASDWVRMKRLNGAKGFMLPVVYAPVSPAPPPVLIGITNPPPRLETRDGGRHVYTEFGTSKTRRPASIWIDYRASQVADYILEGPGTSCGTTKVLVSNKLCTCSTTNPVKHNGLCISCQYDKIVVR